MPFDAPHSCVWCQVPALAQSRTKHNYQLDKRDVFFFLAPSLFSASCGTFNARLRLYLHVMQIIQDIVDNDYVEVSMRGEDVASNEVEEVVCSK